jgi:hypothetical protein
MQMNSLAVLAALALPSAASAAQPDAPKSSTSPAPTPPPGSVESSKIRLDAQDIPGALADAQTVIAEGGGADAYAARADARRAEGGPYEQVLADYAEAAKLDPRYIDKYNGLIAQRDSELHRPKIKGGRGLNGVPVTFIALVAGASALCLGAAAVLSRRLGGVSSAADDEEILPGGKKKLPDSSETDEKTQEPPVKKTDSGSAS